ncbi:MAG: hypothetical protein ABI835_10355 [Chloroflexota bacterium]
MSQQQKKNERIRLQFERFSKICRCIPPGKVEVWEGTSNDPPDISIGDGELGIEFVDFLHGAKSDRGSDLRAIEEDFEKLTKLAEKEFIDSYDFHLDVRILWNDVRPEHTEKEKIIKTLVNLVYASRPQYINELIELWNKDFSDPYLKIYLKQIGIMRLPEEAFPIWLNMKGYNTFVGIEELKKYITRKEKRLKDYRSKFEQVWLVIVAASESRFISTYAIADATVQRGSLVSVFSRVYFYSVIHGEVILLTPDDNKMD